MIIYGALLIPIITIFVLYKFFSHKTVWWEFGIPLLASFILCISSKAIIEVAQVTSKEYWGSFVERIEYYEEWNEWVTQTCTRSCCCDGKGENCGTETYDCSYCRYHPPIWQIITTTGETVDINQYQYSRIKKILGSESFAELNRSYYTIDGDEYYCTWQRDSVRAIPVTTLHHYENRVKVADQSVFHFEKVSDDDIKKYTLKDYPEIKNNYEMDAVIGDSSIDGAMGNKAFQYYNGLLGNKKQVKFFALIFENQPIEAGLYQEWYWSGGNMNEFVICIGIDKQRNVKWCKPISWTPSELLKTKVKDFVQQQKKLNLAEVANYVGKQSEKTFVRKDFKEFDYLTVDPPTWAVILTYLLTIATNVGLSVWIINNEYEE
jgi:hypothetical protein